MVKNMHTHEDNHIAYLHFVILQFMLIPWCKAYNIKQNIFCDWPFTNVQKVVQNDAAARMKELNVLYILYVFLNYKCITTNCPLFCLYDGTSE